MFRTHEFGVPSAFAPLPPGDPLEAAQIEVVIAAQLNESPPMLTDMPPAGLKKVKFLKGNRYGPRKAPCCKTCGQPRKGHARARCVEVVLNVEKPCCVDRAAGCAGCPCA